MVAADAQRIAVAGDHPHHQVRAAGLQAGGNRGRAAVDGVKSVGLHVIGKTAGAANAGYENDFLARHPQIRHDLLRLRQD